jgi:hypothetical protein
MRKRLLLASVMGAIIFAGVGPEAAYASVVGNVLANGDFVYPGAWPPTAGEVAPGWATGNAGTGWTWGKDTTNMHGTLAQKVSKTTSNAGNWGAVRQTLSANVGDAFTLGDAWVYCAADSTKTAATVRVAWDGTPTGIGNATVLATAAQSAGAWYQFTSHPGGNATNTSVTIGFVNRMAPGNAASTDLSTTWDDLVVYRAHVPPAPAVSHPTASSLRVDVNPGGNSANPLAEYAISMGSNWVQADGSVGATQAWLTDTVWGDMTVTGLAESTTYDFQVLARYSDTLTWATLPQGNLGSGTTLPEPATLGLLVLGSLALLRRRR